MTKINSRSKGKRGELEVAALLRAHGIGARRGQQFSGSPDSPDVISAMTGVHLEVKRTEHFQMRAAMAQAKRDSAEGEIPVVVQRGNREEWAAIMPMEDFIKLWQKANGGTNDE